VLQWDDLPTWEGKKKQKPGRNMCLFSSLTPLPFRDCILLLERLGREAGTEREQEGELDPSRPMEVSNHFQLHG